MKKSFKTKGSIVFVGRTLAIMLIAAFGAAFKISYEAIFVRNDFGSVIGFLAIIIVCAIYFKTTVLDIFYPLAFGKLIVSEDGVTYRCFLKKPIFISWGDCGFVGVEEDQQNIVIMKEYGNVYMYFSESELSQEYKGNIGKKKNSQGFIKFYPVTKELCEEVLRYKQSSDLMSFVAEK